MRALVAALLWPVLVLASVSACVWGFTGGIAFGLVIVAVGTIITTIVLEQFVPADYGMGVFFDPQRKNDLGHYIVGGFAAEAIAQAASVLIALGLANQIPTGLNLWPDAWPVRVILVIVAGDLLEYGRHRLFHRSALLWRIHSLHHNSDRMHALKSGRVHALDVGSRLLFVYVPLILVGVPALWLPVYSAALLVLGPIAHGNLDVRLPSWVHSVLVTPAFHSLHHARSFVLSNSNFSAVLPVWDHLFGTFEHPDRHLRPDFGIEDTQTPEGFVAQLSWPFRHRGIE